MVSSNLHIILGIYPSFIHKIELINFGDRIVESPICTANCSFYSTVAKTSCEHILAHYYLVFGVLLPHKE
jgi:hypothetical protein